MFCTMCQKEIDKDTQEKSNYALCNTCYSNYCLTCAYEELTTCECCNESVCYNCLKTCERCNKHLCSECSVFHVEDMVYYCVECSNKLLDGVSDGRI